MARGRSKSNVADVLSFMNRIEGDVSARITSASDDASEELANEILKVSQTYVPRDTGTLASTGKVVKQKDGQYVVEYGEGLERPYAFYVHENMRQDLPSNAASTSVKFAEGKAKNYTTGGTGPKYLERAAFEVASHSNIIKYLRDSLGRFRSRKS